MSSGWRGYRPRRAPGARWRLAALLCVQLLGVGLIVGYHYGEGGALDPNQGLRQLDFLSLHAHVPGLPTVPGRPTMVVASGIGGGCLAQLGTASRLRNHPGGLPARFGLVVLVPVGVAGGPTSVAALRRPGIEVRPDPGGHFAAELALPGAVGGCRPGYALLNSLGVVRYRSYDPQWSVHGGEQSILLAALR